MASADSYRRTVIPPLELRWTFLTASILLILCVPACQGNEDGNDSLIEDEVAPLDQDGDSILDVHEGSGDPDGDGIPNYLDRDSDGDGLADSLEAGDDEIMTFPRDSDGDGEADFLDSDSDGNGIPDQVEVGINPLSPVDFDGDELPDYVDPDNDGDLISDVEEIGGLIPLDTDSDGYPDYYDRDSDGDGILDADEAGVSSELYPPVDTDGDGWPDYRDPDSDEDGLDDALEAGDEDLETPPRDTDGDGAADFVDLDADGDSLSDALESEENTDPYAYDTDQDGASDGVEALAGSDPHDDASLPAIEWIEVRQRDATTGRFEFKMSIGRADVVFILDDTGSMSAVISSLATDFFEVVGQVQERVPDTAFGVATFQDYHGASYGGNSVRPFVLVQQVTENQSYVQSALFGMGGSGGSGETSALEALYQALTGMGFDQDCDLAYDSEEDVRPFISDAEDAFAGGVDGAYFSDDYSPGVLGGMGFRNLSLPILVYATDVAPRDPEAGDVAPPACSPPGVSKAAGKSMVVSAAQDQGARLIGVNVDGNPDLQDTMVTLALETGSMADLDGQGVPDDPLVFRLGGGTSITDAITEGVASTVTSGEFSRVELIGQEDPYGFVSGASPEFYEHVNPGDVLEFEVSFLGTMPARADDQLFTIRLAAIGDQATQLGSLQVIVVVPGERP